MRQSIRKSIILISLLLLPITLNFLSPYVAIDGAMTGIISGSVALFIAMFLTSIFFGRAWCGWLCPIAGLSEMALSINNKSVNVKKLKIIRYSIFTVWASVLIAMFILAGGIKGINPFHLTENGVSVDEPKRYIIYYAILLIITMLTVLIGKRGACHGICWMSPFLVGGFTVGKFLRIPQLRILADHSKCTECSICSKKCPMSIEVNSCVKEGYIKTSDCILCGECVDACKKNVFRYGVIRRN